MTRVGQRCLRRWLQTSRADADDAVLVFSVGGGDLERNVSPNLVEALKEAKARGLKNLGIVGRDRRLYRSCRRCVCPCSGRRQRSGNSFTAKRFRRSSGIASSRIRNSRPDRRNGNRGTRRASPSWARARLTRRHMPRMSQRYRWSSRSFVKRRRFALPRAHRAVLERIGKLRNPLLLRSVARPHKGGAARGDHPQPSYPPLGFQSPLWSTQAVMAGIHHCVGKSCVVIDAESTRPAGANRRLVCQNARRLRRRAGSAPAARLP